MKKLTLAFVSAVLAMVLCCAQALAIDGDITVKSAKAYSDAAMTRYVGKLPAGLALAVRSYGASRISVKGKTVYVANSALLSGDGFARNGSEDMLLRDAKAYSDLEMTQFVGTIPEKTIVKVQAYGTNAAVAVNGRTVYIDNSKLLNGDMAGEYNARLDKGARVYQLPSAKARSVRLKKGCVVNICAVKGDWALVRQTAGNLMFGYVKRDQLSDFEEM